MSHIDHGISLLNKLQKKILSGDLKKQSTNTDLFIGFFGYELLNNLIDVKVPKQKNLNFPKGIFYKPEKKIKLSNNLKYNLEKFESGIFKININKKNYTKIFKLKRNWPVDIDSIEDLQVASSLLKLKK